MTLKQHPRYHACLQQIVYLWENFMNQYCSEEKDYQFHLRPHLPDCEPIGPLARERTGNLATYIAPDDPQVQGKRSTFGTGFERNSAGIVGAIRGVPLTRRSKTIGGDRGLGRVQCNPDRSAATRIAPPCPAGLAWLPVLAMAWACDCALDTAGAM